MSRRTRAIAQAKHRERQRAKALDETIKEAMRHPDKPGAGEAQRKKLPVKERGEEVMKEFERGTLRSGSGHHVTNKKQAEAIAEHESGRDSKVTVDSVIKRWNKFKGIKNADS